MNFAACAARAALSLSPRNMWVKANIATVWALSATGALSPSIRLWVCGVGEWAATLLILSPTISPPQQCTASRSLPAVREVRPRSRTSLRVYVEDAGSTIPQLMDAMNGK